MAVVVLAGGQFHAGRSPVDQDLEGGKLITVRREDGGFESVALLATSLTSSSRMGRECRYAVVRRF